MKHETLIEIKEKADIISLPAMPMSRRERLERWAAVMDQHQENVAALIRIEDYSRQNRMSLRGEGTPLAIAFADPVLRREGLKGDTLGEAMTFFGLSHGQAHRLLCDCHYLGSMTGPRLAARLRSIAQGGLFQRLVAWTRSRPAMG